MATVTERTKLPDEARLVTDLVERLGFKWELDTHYPLNKIDLARRVQIRTEGNYTPSEQVSRYRQAMKAGDKFPPVVISKDGCVVDGNTRVEAARRNQYPTIQAVVLDQSYEGSPESTRQRYRGLGAAFNIRNGKGINQEETRAVVYYLANNPNYDATRLAALLGVAEHVVQAFMAERRAKERAKQGGVELNGSVKASQLRILGTAKINEGPWRRLATLVRDSGMQPAELRQLVKSVRESGSDQKALAILDDEYEARRLQIAEYKATNKSQPPASAQLRQHLGFLLKEEFGVRSFTEFNPNKAVEHLDTVERALALLVSIAEAQREHNAGMEERAA